MIVKRHRQRASNLIEAVGIMASVDAALHFEAAVELAVHAATHCFNILLHESDVTNENSDQIHSDMPSEIGNKLSSDLKWYFDALVEIEFLRMAYVRGNKAQSSVAEKRFIQILGLFMPILDPRAEKLS